MSNEPMASLVSKVRWLVRSPIAWLVVTVLSGCQFALVQPENMEAHALTDNFVSAIQAGDRAAAFALLSKPTQEAIGAEEFTTAATNFSRLLPLFEKIKAPSGSYDELPIGLTDRDGAALSIMFVMVQEEDMWKIAHLRQIASP